MEILKRVVNNKLRMVYYLIVYTVLLVQFPKTKFVGPPINKTWIRHCAVRSQCIKTVNTANRVLGMIKKTTSVRNKDIILQLYKSLVRPHLEFSVPAWRPHFQKDIDLIEGVQRRATKLYNHISQR